jgi:hypothetical protein
MEAEAMTFKAEVKELALVRTRDSLSTETGEKR